MTDSIQILPSVQPNLGQRVNQVPDQRKSFAESLKNAVNKISEREQETNIKTELLAQGKIDNLHDVMISAQKASLTVETAVQIQQKVIDTYNEMMRMQV